MRSASAHRPASAYMIEEDDGIGQPFHRSGAQPSSDGTDRRNAGDELGDDRRPLLERQPERLFQDVVAVSLMTISTSRVRASVSQIGVEALSEEASTSISSKSPYRSKSRAFRQPKPALEARPST